jgi:hypothetical protein
MKSSRVPPLVVVCLAVIACLAGQAGASDWANPNASSYGYGAPGNGYGTAGYSSANFAPDMAGYSGYSYAGYGGSGYVGYGYNYADCGNGGCGNGGCGHHHGRRHCCSFGGNCNCCTSSWDGYCGCWAAGGVKVHHRHRALGRGAGPCVDDSCGYGSAANCGRPHRCFLRRNRGAACCTDGGCSDCAGGTLMDTAPGQPAMMGPTPTEFVPPSTNVEAPSPGDDSST